MKPWTLTLLVVLATAAPCAAQTANPVVILDTNHGVIKLELFADQAPLTVKNFLLYADDRFYDGTIFHRVMNNFMIQGGGMTPGLQEKKARAPVKYEDNGLLHKRGHIALARAIAPDSGTSQFFINVVDLPHLDRIKPGYVVFGKVTAGMDVVDKIKLLPTGNKGGHQNVPLEDVVIKSMSRASHFALALTGAGAYAVNNSFTISAYIEHPVPGQALTLELPAGLERIDGREIQPVAAGGEAGMSLVVWRIRGLQAGEYDCVVRSSTGVVQTKKIKITSPTRQAPG